MSVKDSSIIIAEMTLAIRELDILKLKNLYSEAYLNIDQELYGTEEEKEKYKKDLLSNILSQFVKIYEILNGLSFEKENIYSFIDDFINFIDIEENYKYYYKNYYKYRDPNNKNSDDYIKNIDITLCPNEYKKIIYSIKIQIATRELNFSEMENLLLEIKELTL